MTIQQTSTRTDSSDTVALGMPDTVEENHNYVVAPNGAPQEPTRHNNQPQRQNEQEEEEHQLWMDSPFAIGRTPLTWAEEAADCSTFCLQPFQPTRRTKMYWTAFCCAKLGAGRVGNMIVLWQSSNNNRSSNSNNSSNQTTTRPSAKNESLVSSPSTVPTLHLVVGPYWTVTLCVTLPLISLVSVATYFRTDMKTTTSTGLFVAWIISTTALLISLCKVATTNPGILPRHNTAPAPPATTTTTEEEQEQEQWIWNDQAYTFRPRHAKFDVEIQAVVEHYDHTCPWTGTAIGGGNMFWFRSFLVFLFVTLFFDVIVMMVG